MAAFDANDSRWGDLDFRLVMNTFVTLFWRPAVLEQTVGWLLTSGYQVVRVDASQWTSQEDTRALGIALGFRDYTGRSLDALNDYLGDVASYEYIAAREATGLVLVLAGYDKFVARCPYPAQAILDMFARQARSAALIGHRMIRLVQSDDPDIEFAPVGAVSVDWNDAEAAATKRHRKLAGEA